MDSMTITERLCDVHPDTARHLAQKLHRKKEEFSMVRKFYLADQQGTNDDERAVTARVSTPDVDRDGEVVLSEGIDTTEYVKNGVLLWAHRYDQPAIGRSVWPPKIDKNGMVCKFQFAKTQFADEIYQLYRDGYMKAFSIGFIPLDYDKETKTHRKISLLEISCVPVPANQNAVVMEAFQKGIITSDVLKKDFGLDDAPVRTEEEKGDIPVQVEEVAPAPVETPKEAEAKILDAENNPSMQDIFMAIERALNPPQEKPQEVGAPPVPWYSVNEIYPVNFPSGHCIFTEYLPGRKVQPSYRQDYIFSDGLVTLAGERVEVVAAWRKKDDSPSIGEATVKITADIKEFAEQIEGVKVALVEVLKLKEQANALIPSPDDRLPELIAEVRAVGENVAELMATVEGMKAPAINISTEGAQKRDLQAKDQPDILPDILSAPAPPPAPVAPVDIKADIRAVISELPIKSILADAVKLEISRLRGRVE